SVRVFPKLAFPLVPTPFQRRLPPGHHIGTGRSQLIRRLGATIALRPGGRRGAGAGPVPVCVCARGAGRGGGRIVESGAERRGRAHLSAAAGGGTSQRAGGTAGPAARARPPPPREDTPPPPPRWWRPAPADRPGIPAPSPAAPPPLPPPPPPPPPPHRPPAAAAASAPAPAPAPAPPWETPAASAARRPACRRAAPAASGDFQKKQPDDDSTPSTSNSQTDLFSGETNSDNSNTSLTTQAANSNQQLLTELNVTSPSKEEYSQSESEASPVKRPRLLDDSNDRPEETSRSKQKSRRRCFQCQTKLELVQQELGSCRCGYVFCMLHRLPEQHDCTFDHMGRGREEAIMKMVKLDRKVGRSCQRIGEGCS
uniref:Zinc finger AN1-type containing 3 n=1 Tax=Cairina moschata TaxID=8855 RepID=A0A8C3CMA3_CAIMO